MKRVFQTLLFLLVVIVSILFATKNYHSVEFNYLVSQVSLPLSILLLLSFVLGVAIGVAVVYFQMMRLRLGMMKLKHQNKKASKALDSQKQEAGLLKAKS
ncbi:MAG: lipopolysaccharide assembly protein LapA domain-containing protein [Gammaproteobacteria bacterium]|nr:lipopolysaccharide assembly protein LapA domain-containing protein [Gammaproteobacteria bacterium]